METVIVLAVLAAVVALAIRYLVRQKKKGHTCTGDCGRCKGCH